MFRYSEDGGGTGCPGVPTERAVLAPPLPFFANSAIVMALGCDENAALIGSNSLTSAWAAIGTSVASLLRYCDLFPGFGWSLIHCGPLPPLDFASASIVSNMCASERGS